MSKNYICVPYEGKELAKKLGVKWDITAKKWYIPENLDESVFSHWKGGNALFPYLYIDLVPQSAWYTNLRSILKASDWDKVRKYAYKRASYVCEICGESGRRHPVEAHERWKYDDVNHTQTLVEVQALCPSCHLASHMGFAASSGRFEEAVFQMMKVNNWDEDQMNDHYMESFVVWEKRSAVRWKIDITWIEKVFGKEMLLRAKSTKKG